MVNKFDASYRPDSPTSTEQILAYAFPVLPVTFLYAGLTVLQGIYAKHFGLALTSIATVLFIARLFDAITDPIIGYSSDKYYSTHKTRKPFIVVGGILLICSSYFLYVPVNPKEVTVAYFLGWFLMFYLAWTIFEIPHLALGGELANSAKEKNYIYSLRVAGGNIGGLLFFIIPLMPFNESNNVTPETLKWSVVGAAILMTPSLYLTVKATQSPSKKHERKASSKRSVLLQILSNRPLFFFSVTFLFFGVGVGMWFSLMFIFVDMYLGMGELFAPMMLVSLCISTISIGLWYKLANSFGKRTVWALGIVVAGFAVIGTSFLSAGEVSFSQLLLVSVVGYSGFAASSVISPSLLSDIVDYSAWKYGVDNGASYFSVKAIMLKSTYAIGGSLGLAIAGSYGFDPNIATHNVESVFGLKLAVSWLPSLFILMSLLFVALVPINSRRHKIIKRRLNIRNIRLAQKPIYK